MAHLYDSTQFRILKIEQRVRDPFTKRYTLQSLDGYLDEQGGDTVVVLSPEGMSGYKRFQAAPDDGERITLAPSALRVLIHRQTTDPYWRALAEVTANETWIEEYPDREALDAMQRAKQHDQAVAAVRDAVQRAIAETEATVAAALSRADLERELLVWRVAMRAFVLLALDAVGVESAELDLPRDEVDASEPQAIMDYLTSQVRAALGDSETRGTVR